jgi:rhodanese-related sulfurtransferase
MKLLLIGISLVILVAACGSNEDDNKQRPTREVATVEGGGVYQTLTMDQFADIVANRADEYQIINVHTPYAGEVENTDALIPYDDLDALMSALPDKSAPIILYCRSGRMSEEASRALLERGYTQVWDVPGGMVAWEESGRTLIQR